MIRTLIIPQELGESIEVRLLDWLKKEGDIVDIGDALLEFETDKAIVLVAAAQPGFLRRVFVEAGGWMKPGEVAAWLSDQSEEPLPQSIDPNSENLTVTFDVT